jgi:hypothetical protein
MHCNYEMYRIRSKQKVLILLCLSIAITTSLASTTDFGLATPENNTLMQPQGTQNMSTNATNIVLESMVDGPMEQDGPNRSPS